MSTQRLDREIWELRKDLDGLPVDDPGRQPLRAILRGKRARLTYRLRASERAFEAYIVRFDAETEQIRRACEED